MALVKPILNNIASFDVAQPKDISFTVSGGDRPVKAILNINVSNTNYKKSYIQNISSTTSDYTITIPANFLTGDNFGNGVNYEMSVATYNYQGQMSEQSDIQFVTTYTSPIVDIISPNSIYGNSTLLANFTYSQEQDEKINKYSFKLFNSIGTQLEYSGDIFYKNNTSLQYQFSTVLNNNKTYSVQFNIVTMGGTEIIIEQVFTTQYILSNDYFPLIIDDSDTCDTGMLVVRSELVVFEGKVHPYPPIYVDNDYVVLTEDGSYVIFDDGFSINSNYVMMLQFNSPVMRNISHYGGDNYAIAKIYSKNKDSYIIINIIEDASNQSNVYAELCVMDAPFYYRIYSTSIAKATPTQNYRVFIKRVDNLYDIEMKVADK